MELHTHRWGSSGPGSVMCVHGITQHGAVFEKLAKSFGDDRRTVSVDLRGHGSSGSEPPWNTDTHVDDLLDTADAVGVQSACWIGHSFGALLVAALAAREPERVDQLVLLDPSFGLSASYALQSAEMDRRDWSFASVDGAVNALLASDAVVAAPNDVVSAYAHGDLQRGSDGRLRFRYCPSAVVAAWSEMVLPPPPVANVPTLLVRPVVSAVHQKAEDSRYRKELGSLLTVATVPNGHNVLWESPAQTFAAIHDFLAQPGPVTSG